MSASDGLGPLPEAVHQWRTDVPGRAGPLLSPLFTAAQMRAFRAAGVAAERDRMDMLRAFVADDAIACTYQSLGQYRSAILRALRA